ncbi:MAG: DUF2723 domain-containing protein [Elusimicrobia bacterium]|nr:DUF2723 domain-containing protein [Elusimicrobiota bacterium]
MRLPILIFLAFFGLYLYCLYPALAPYRDAGEMAVGAQTLGVLHPPGYPLYLLVSRLFRGLPFGNLAYRLNLGSALAAALCLVCLAAFLRRLCGTAPMLLALCALGFSSIFWELALVSEMYSLGIFFLSAALLCWFFWERTEEGRYLFLGSFLYGLGLGVRMDLLLVLPAWLVLFYKRKPRAFPLAGHILFFWLLGFSVYLYLPLRSAQFPWLDWNHPATLERFWSTLTRQTHGGTLDLLSKNYALGSLFWPQMRLYLEHLWGSWGAMGLLSLLGLGAAGPWRRFLWVGFLCSGPLFILLANLPPNPHAVAILEAHYLLPDFFLAMALAFGIRMLRQGEAFVPSFRRRAFVAICIFGGLHALWGRWEKNLRRNHWMAEDYAGNLLASLPPRAVLVAREDVQLFSLWYFQRVRGIREDVTVVPQGLSGSSWHQRILLEQEPRLHLVKLQDQSSWSDFLRANRGRGLRLFATGDAEVPALADLESSPWGLAGSWETPPRSAGWLWDLYVLRFPRRYGEFPDFFSNDLTEEYAKGRFREGTERLKMRAVAEGMRHLHEARWLKPQMPEPATWLGFYFSQQGDWERARRYYREQVRLQEALLQKARQYRALPEVLSGIEQALAEAHLNHGVSLEKTKEWKAAGESYERALHFAPRSAQAHYNLAVLYWGRDWQKALEYLQKVLETDPNHPQARRYLPLVQERLRPAR